MKKSLKIAAKISSILLGLVFLAGGVFKLMDPVGAGLVMDEYLSFLHMDFMREGSEFFGVAFALVEALTGAALVCGVWKVGTWVVSGALLLLFTLLTLLLLIYNPSMDCGCFGEVVKLTHLQSFLKNLVLLALWGLTSARPGFDGVLKFGHLHRYGIFGAVSAGLILFMILSLNRLPLMDFTSMAPGTELFGYSNPSGPLLSVRNIETDEYIEDWEGKTLVVSSYEPLTPRQTKRIQEVLAASPVPVLQISSIAGTPCFADPRTILALNRSNGGFTYISDGQVVAKWHNSEASDVAPSLSTSAEDLLVTRLASGQKHFQLVLFGFLVLLLI